MKHFFIQWLSAALALAMLLSLVGVAEDLSFNGLELQDIDAGDLLPDGAFIGEGGALELAEFEDEIPIPEASDGIGEALDVDPSTEALAVDAGMEAAMDAMAASVGEAMAENDAGFLGGTVGQTGVQGTGASRADYDIPGARADNDVLADAYLLRVLPGLGRGSRGGRYLASPGAGRQGLVKKGLAATVALYDALKPMIAQVAAGERTSTQFEFDSASLGLSFGWWTAEALGISGLDDEKLGTCLLEQEGIDSSALLFALLEDCPYDLYWFDKAKGWSVAWSYYISGDSAQLDTVALFMTVAEGYAADTYEVNALPAYVSAAVANINAAISGNAGKGNLDKLTAYADIICGYVEYNDSAADNDGMPYGDPWQLVWIFDGNDDTKVVCEGYAKGFKYLCDLSSFKGDVGCVLAEGEMAYGTGAGRHMWNSLKMPDGRCYLVDLTNCDDGDSCDYSLFLKGCEGEAGGPYICGGLRYEFDDALAERFGGDMFWLTYSNTDYGVAPPLEPTAEPTAAPTPKPTAAPTAKPTPKPTAKPTAAPTAKPTAKPTVAPTAKPTAKPTAAPTAKPTVKPTVAPTAKPTAAPTAKPTVEPTATPTDKPTAEPTAKPTVAPTALPTSAPTAAPTPMPKIKLSKCKVTVKDKVYTGKALKPAVTVKYGGKALKAGTDYTISYKNNKAVGVATATVKGKGRYTGTKKVTFKILPRAGAVSKLTAGKQRLKITWKKRAEATGYQLQYALKSGFSGAKTVKVKGAGTVSVTVKKLKSGKKYYVRVRAYSKVGKKTYYSAWSKAKGAKVK